MEIHQYWTVPRLRKEVEAAVQSFRKGKSARVDNIPAELVLAGREDVITALTTICNKIWQTGEWPTPWTQSLVITLPKKSNLQQCQKYRTITHCQPYSYFHQLLLAYQRSEAFLRLWCDILVACFILAGGT